MKKHLCSLATVALLSLSAAANASITLNAMDQGWITNQFFPFPNNGSSPANNYFAGFCPNCPSGLNTEYRNWFQFALPTQLGNVQSATLVLNVGSLALEQSPSITYSVTSIPTSFAFSNLGTETFYGSRTYSISDSNQTESISLDASAISNLYSAAGGVFDIGGRITSPISFQSSQSQFVFGNSQNNSAQLVITTSPVPVPAAAWLLGSGLLGLGGIARKRKVA